jgi:hypothetical protein
MILQALNDYYRRKAADPDPRQRLPAFGLEEKEIPFIIEITPTAIWCASMTPARPRARRRSAVANRYRKG